MDGAVGEEEKSEKNDDIDDRFMIHGTIVYSLYFVYYELASLPSVFIPIFEANRKIEKTVYFLCMNPIYC